MSAGSSSQQRHAKRHISLRDKLNKTDSGSSQPSATYKAIDELDVGDVIVGPAFRLDEINNSIGYPYSTSTESGKRMHKHIVLRIDKASDKYDPRVWTAMLTSNGSVSRVDGESMLSRYDALPATRKAIESEERWLKMMNVEYDETSQRTVNPDLYHWVNLAWHAFVYPLRDGKGQGKYIIIPGVKFSKRSVDKLKGLLEKGARLVNQIKLGNARADEVSPGDELYKGVRMQDLPGIARASVAQQEEGWEVVAPSRKRTDSSLSDKNLKRGSRNDTMGSNSGTSKYQGRRG